MKERVQELRINQSFEVIGVKSLSEAKEQLEKRFERNNRKAENQFWDNLELIEVIEEDETEEKKTLPTSEEERQGGD